MATKRYWHALNDSSNRMQCDLCPRYCKMAEGQRGLCYVRGNKNGEIQLLTYGRSSGFCIDPIEKKPLNHFLPGTPVLSFGTAGCNLACKFCQNWDISKSRENDTLASQATPIQIANAATNNHCRSVAYTYNDPIIFYEYALDVATACLEQSIKNVAVTAGYICEQPREAFFNAMDAVNVDLKAFTEEFYVKVCGGHLQPVLDTIEYIHTETNCWLELTNLLIPGQNDGENELNQLCQWVLEKLGPNIPIHFSAFHPDWKMTNLPRTPMDTLITARQIAINIGLNYVYTGNVHHQEGDTTYCPHCKTPVIERDWYQLRSWQINEGKYCKKCNSEIAGVFEPTPGTWGAQRKVIQPANY